MPHHAPVNPPRLHPRLTPRQLLTAVFLLLVFSVGFAPAQAQSGPIIVRVGGEADKSLPDKNQVTPQQRAERAVVDAFEREHPGVQLVNANGLQIKGPAADSNLLMSFAGGTAPDVVYVNFRSMDNYIEQGFLQPLDNYLAANPSMMAGVNPQIRQVIQVNGHVYAMPYQEYVQALYYRKDLFQQAGLDPNKPPATWDEFYNDCRRITNQPQGVWGFEWPTLPGDQAYWWENLLWQAGGEVAVKNPQGQWVAAFDSPAGAEALEFYKHLVADKYVSPIDGKTYVGVASQGTPGYSDDRGRNKVAMWFAYQSNVIANVADTTQINPSVLGIAPMPRGPGKDGRVANEINAGMWALSSQIKSPRVREAAWQFIKFMASDQANRIRTQAYVEQGLGFLINPVTLQKYGYGDEAAAQSGDWQRTSRILFTHGHPEPHGANMESVYELMGAPLQAIALHPDSNPRVLLADAARQVDQKLIDYTPPRVMRKRREIAWTIFTGLIVVAASTLTLQVRKLLSSSRRVGVIDSVPESAAVATAAASSFAGGESTTYPVGGSYAGVGGRTQPRSLKRQSPVLAWLFMAPALLSILVWAYVPLGRGLVMAFQDYHLILPAHFVGLDNFIDAAVSYTFWIGILNALLYTLYTLALGFLLPILIAVMLNEIPFGTVALRFLFYLPAITASLVVNLLWGIFENGSPGGLFNQIAAMLHLPSQNWLGDPKWALLAVVLPGVWASAGPGCIIYLAALKSIPTDFYEAADLDGASPWTKLWRITFPQLLPLIAIQLVGAVVGAFQVTDRILAMTGGGPLYATHTIGYEIWENAFLYLRFGYATAAAWMMGMLLIGFTTLQLRAMTNLRFAASGRS